MSSVVTRPETKSQTDIKSQQSSPYRAICLIQGLYYFVTGLWPLLSIDSFQAVTGPKTDHLVTGRPGDHWLVYTVAALITAESLVFLFAAWRAQPVTEVAILAIASSLALISIDIIFVVRQTIHSIYLGDAVAEVILIFIWLLVVYRGRWRLK